MIWFSILALKFNPPIKRENSLFHNSISHDHSIACSDWPCVRDHPVCRLHPPTDSSVESNRHNTVLAPFRRFAQTHCLLAPQKIYRISIRPCRDARYSTVAHSHRLRNSPAMVQSIGRCELFSWALWIHPRSFVMIEHRPRVPMLL